MYIVHSKYQVVVLIVYILYTRKYFPEMYFWYICEFKFMNYIVIHIPHLLTENY